MVRFNCALPWLLAPLALFAAACGGGQIGSSGGGGATASGGAGGTGGTTATGGGGTGGLGGTGGAATGGGGAGGAPMKSPYHLVGRFDESNPERPTSTWSGSTITDSVIS